MFRSIRWTLLGWYCLILLVVVAGFGSVLYWHVRRAKWDEIESQLVREAQFLATGLQDGQSKAKEKTKVKAEAQEKTKEEKSKAEEEKETQTVEKNSDELSEEEQQIALALRTWRKDKANELQQPEFMIFPNATLHALAKGKPRSMDQLESIKGIGPAKITRYGDDLMAILNAF